MQTKSILFLVVLIGLHLAGCEKQPDVNFTTIKIPEKASALIFEELVDSVRIFQINDDDLYGEILKVDIIGNLICLIVLDGVNQNKDLRIYDTNGYKQFSWLETFQDSLHGFSVSHAFYDQDLDNYYILDDIQNSVYVFSFKDYDFKKLFSLPFDAKALVKTPDAFVLYKTAFADKGEDSSFFNHIHYLNQSGEILNSYLPFSLGVGMNHGIMNISPFSTYNEEIYYSDILNDTIYNVSEKGLTANFVLNFAENAIPRHLLKLSKYEVLLSLQQQSIPGSFGTANFTILDSGSYYFNFVKNFNKNLFFTDTEKNYHTFSEIYSETINSYISIPIVNSKYLISINDEYNLAMDQNLELSMGLQKLILEQKKVVLVVGTINIKK